MLGNIISQLYRIADLLKDKKLVDKDSNTDNNSSEDNTKELTLNDIYQHYKSELEVLVSNNPNLSSIDPFPETFDDIELIEVENLSKTGIYKCSSPSQQVLFSYITHTDFDSDVRYFVCFLRVQDVNK